MIVNKKFRSFDVFFYNLKKMLTVHGHKTPLRTTNTLRSLCFSVNIIALAKIQGSAINIKQALYNCDSSP